MAKNKDNTAEEEVVDKNKSDKPDAKPSKDKKKAKKKEPGKVRRWFKDFFSELKKVTWPSFTKVLKQTGVVLLVTIVFLLVLMAFDSLFGYLYDLLVSGLPRVETDTASAVMSAVAVGIKSVGGGMLL